VRAQHEAMAADPRGASDDDMRAAARSVLTRSLPVRGEERQNVPMPSPDHAVALMGEAIVGPAILWPDGTPAWGFVPSSHYSVSEGMKKIAPDATPLRWEQGFMTTTGRFVDRKEAYGIAKLSQQIVNPRGGGGRLFSEDLWLPCAPAPSEEAREECCGITYNDCHRWATVGKRCCAKCNHAPAPAEESGEGEEPCEWCGGDFCATDGSCRHVPTPEGVVCTVHPTCARTTPPAAPQVTVDLGQLAIELLRLPPEPKGCGCEDADVPSGNCPACYAAHTAQTIAILSRYVITPKEER
jgi:hypothetical protein